MASQLHEAAVDPQRWSSVLRAVGEAFDGLACGLRFEDADQQVSQLWWGLPATFERAYLDHFHQQDPWMPGARSLPLGRCVPSQALVPDDVLDRSEFYRDLLRPHGLREIVGGVVEKSNAGITTFAVMRADGARCFDAIDAAQLDALIPRIRQAIWVERQLAELETPGLQGRSNPNRVGLFVLDLSGRIASANPAAEHLLRAGDALCSRSGELRAACPISDQELRRGVLGAVPGAAQDPASTRTLLAIQRTSGPALVASVSPLTESVSPVRIPGPRPAILVLVHDPVAPIDLLPVETALRNLYRLTPAEARVAALVGSGHSPAQTAARLKITPGTARFQLKQVYARTGVDGQRGLVRLVSFLAGL